MSVLADLRAIATRLCPALCPRCDGPADRGFCLDCRLEFRRVAEPCPTCGLPGPCHCTGRRETSWHIDAVTAPYLYARPVSDLLHRLKYGRERPLGRAFGLLLADALRDADRVDAIVPVPLHGARLRERTFNQADEIALALAGQLRIRLLTRGIGRRLATRPQANLVRAERIANVACAFTVSGEVRGLHVAIVDDVVTTGATVNALAVALKRAGASRVAGWAVARAVAAEGRDVTAP
jgi:ComF family protein